MLSAILGFLGILPQAFSAITSITNAISNEKIAAITATTAEEKIAAEERVSTLQAQRDVMIADASHSKVDLWIRAGLAIGPTAYTIKYYVWDKVLQDWTHGSTDPINPDMAKVLIATIGFYFLYSGAVGVTKIMRS